MDASNNSPKLEEVILQYGDLVVENYQRTYSWKEEQIRELFDDLCDIAPTKNTHFFGTLILQDRKCRKHEKCANIVDGQQRLTTVFILVSALRDQLLKMSTHEINSKQSGKKPINVLHRTWNFLYPGDDLTEPRFISNRFLREIMAESVLAEPDNQLPLPKKGASPTKDFRKGVLLVRELVSKDLSGYESEDEKLHRINELLDSLLSKFRVLKVSTSNINESLEIFLTLNNRGLPLGPSDIVRGQIMAILGKDQDERQQSALQKKILDDWREIADNVRDPESFMRHYLVATNMNKEKIQKSKVVDEVMRRIASADSEDKHRLARDLWDELIEASNVYRRILNPDMGGDTQYYLELLHGLLKSHRVFLLTALGMDFEEKERNELVRWVFILSFKWVMAGQNAQTLENFFQSQSVALREGAKVSEVVNEFQDRVNDLPYDSFKFFENDADSSFVTRAALHYINKRLAPNAAEIELSAKNLHLEHVAPQSETPDWKLALFSSDEEKYEDYESVIRSGGNLTLLDKGLNIQAKQKPFDDKKVHYDESALVLTRDFLKITHWDEAMIQARTQWLSEMFDILWSGSTSSRDVVYFSKWLKKNGDTESDLKIAGSSNSTFSN